MDETEPAYIHINGERFAAAANDPETPQDERRDRVGRLSCTFSASVLGRFYAVVGEREAPGLNASSSRARRKLPAALVKVVTEELVLPSEDFNEKPARSKRKLQMGRLGASRSTGLALRGTSWHSASIRRENGASKCGSNGYCRLSPKTNMSQKSEHKQVTGS